MTAIVRKDSSIWMLVAHLARAFGGAAFQLVDHWDGDLFAIGVASTQNARRLVYISTFQTPPDTFDYECELPGDQFVYATAAKGAHVTLFEMMRVVEQHLAIGKSSDEFLGTASTGPALDVTLCLGNEFDDVLRQALMDVVKELGGVMVDHMRGIAGSQDVEIATIEVGGQRLLIESETYIGLTITGARPLVIEIEKRVRARR